MSDQKLRSSAIRWAAIMLVLAALACNTPSGGEETATVATAPPTQTSETAEATATEEATEATPEETAEDTGDQATLTPTDIPPTTTQCEPDASFDSDVTIPDGTEIATGQSFEKKWRVYSSGCAAWPSGTTFVFDHGDQMGGPASSPVPDAALAAAMAGDSVDISLNLTAPNTPGTYKGYWQLKAPDGKRFGPVLYVEIKAVAPATGNKPDLIITSVLIEPGTPLDEKVVTLYLRVENIGSANSAPSTLDFTWVEVGGGTTRPVPALVPQGSHTVEVGYTMDTGTYTMDATVDSGNQNDESNENNNHFSQSMTVHAWGTYATKSLTVDWFSCVDLDEGTVGACNANTDFRWNMNTGGAGYVQYWLVPQNSALFAIYGTGAPGITDCMMASLSGGTVDGGQTNPSLAWETEGLMEGTYVCYMTSSGRFGTFRVNGRLPDFELGFTTWEID
jgi:hypothetical protein